MANDKQFSDDVTEFGELIMDTLEHMERQPQDLRAWKAGQAVVLITRSQVLVVPANKIGDRSGSMTGRL